MRLTRSLLSLTYVVATIPCRSAVLPRHGNDEHGSLVRVKLIKKLALVLDGIDVTPYCVGDEFACSQEDGHLLILEGWAQHVDEEEYESGIVYDPPSESVMAIIDRLREGLKER